MIAGGARFIYNPAAQLELAKDPLLFVYLRGLAESVAEVARAIGPVDDTPPHYVDEIEVDTAIEEHGIVARVNANKFTSHWIEFGTGEPGPTPEFAPLRRAAEQVGLHLTDGGDPEA